MKIKLYLLNVFILFGVKSLSQTNDEFYKRALQLNHESKFEESFEIFRQLLKSDSANVNYLHNTSFLYCKMGFGQPTEASRMDFYRTGEYLAKKALAIDKNSAGAHYSYAVALGRLNEHASNKQKIAVAKQIKQEADMAVKLDPKLAGAYHVLGRWHRTIAGFNTFEKLMINTMFGGVPEGGSYEAAIESFTKAIQLEPNNIIHYYELAQTYYERDNKSDKIYAKVWVMKAIELPENKNDKDYPVFKKKCEELLQKVK